MILILDSNHTLVKGKERQVVLARNMLTQQVNVFEAKDGQVLDWQERLDFCRLSEHQGMLEYWTGEICDS